jgi:hypothetical protein
MVTLALLAAASPKGDPLLLGYMVVFFTYLTWILFKADK